MREEKEKDEKKKKKAEAANTLKMLHWNLNLPREACLLKMTNNLTPSTGLTLPTNLLPLHPLKPFYFPIHGFHRVSQNLSMNSEIPPSTEGGDREGDTEGETLCWM